MRVMPGHITIACEVEDLDAAIAVLSPPGILIPISCRTKTAIVSFPTMARSVLKHQSVHDLAPNIVSLATATIRPHIQFLLDTPRGIFHPGFFVATNKLLHSSRSVSILSGYVTGQCSYLSFSHIRSSE
jgi:hypothetical protein